MSEFLFGRFYKFETVAFIEDWIVELFLFYVFIGLDCFFIGLLVSSIISEILEVVAFVEGHFYPWVIVDVYFVSFFSLILVFSGETHVYAVVFG